MSNHLQQYTDILNHWLNKIGENRGVMFTSVHVDINPINFAEVIGTVAFKPFINGEYNPGLHYMSVVRSDCLVGDVENLINKADKGLKVGLHASH